MKKLKTADLPAFSRCIKRIGIKDEIRTLAENADQVSDIWGFGFDLVWKLFDMATEKQGEQEIYAFLARPFEMTPEEVAEMDLSDFFAAVKQLAEENNLTAFFKSAQALMK